MPGVARPNAGRTRTLIADQTASSAIIPVLFYEGATGRSEGTFCGHFALRLFFLFLDR